MYRIEVEVASRGLYLLGYLFIIAGTITTVYFIAPPAENSTLIFLLAAAPIYLIFEHLTKKFYRGKIIIEMNKEGLRFAWTKQFIFHNRPNFFLKWSEISEHSYDSSNHLDQFVLKLKNGKKVKIFFRLMDLDFMDFYQKMQELTYEVSKNDDSVRITRNVGFFETEIGKWLIFGFGLLILASSFLILKNKDQEELNLVGVIVLFLFGLAMVGPRVLQLIKMWSKGSKNQKT